MYVEAAILNAPGLGKGHGPLNHFHSLSLLPFSRGHFLDYVLEHPDVAGPWQRFVDHPFVKALGDGSLPLDSFRGYLIQDYLYLVGAGANRETLYRTGKEAANAMRRSTLLAPVLCRVTSPAR